MRTFSILLTVWLLATQSHAQTQVHWLTDTIGHEHRPSLLDRTHPPASAVLPDNGLRESLRMKLYEQQNQFLMQAPRAQLPDTVVTLRVRAYYRADGTAKVVWLAVAPPLSGLRLVVVRPNQPRPNPAPTAPAALAQPEKERIARLMRLYYETYRYPVAVAGPFREESVVSLGKPMVSQRSVRRGAGVIATPEAARRTDQPDTVKILSFSLLGLTSLPSDLYRFVNLEELDLSKNALTTLPANLLTALPRLQRLILSFNQLDTDSLTFARNRTLQLLNLQGNRLTTVPNSVRQNRRLTGLWLGNNPLTTIDLRGLSRLTDLNLYNAGLTELPRRIGRLRRLLVLDAYHNRLSTLPHSLRRLHRLKQLALSHNELRTLPVGLGRLKRLQQLYVHHKQLSQLPDDLARLTSLSLLDLNHNDFSVIPDVLTRLPSLADLDLSNNNVQELPAGLAGLPNLKKLYLRSNPLTQTPARLAPYLGLIERLEARQTEVFR
jgi:Leucine-rich repeat (LRR) protein